MAKNTTTTSATDDTTTTDDAGLGDAGKRALQSERQRARNAEADAKAARDELAALKKDSDATKSQMDKVLEKLAAMETKATQAERRALLAEVAGKTGLSMAKVQRLHGDTVEDLVADAAEVFDLTPGDNNGGTGTEGAGTEGAAGTGDTGAKPAPKGRPKETGDTGGKAREGSGTGAADEKSGDELADEVWKRTHGGL